MLFGIKGEHVPACLGEPSALTHVQAAHTLVSACLCVPVQPVEPLLTK